AAVAHGHTTGNCSFCARDLTDPRSTSVGYGPICAQHFGLPWGDTGAAAARIAAPRAPRQRSMRPTTVSMLPNEVEARAAAVDVDALRAAAIAAERALHAASMEDVAARQQLAAAQQRCAA